MPKKPVRGYPAGTEREFPKLEDRPAAPKVGSEALPTTLTKISDRKLISQVKKLTRLERVSTLQILLHLIEIERRELHLGLGYRSMFDYCVRCLRYSASAATRRIQTARCLARHPEVYVMLQRAEVNLTTVSLVSKALTDENKRDLLTRIANKTQRQVEVVIAKYGPPIAYRDRVRSVCVRVETAAPHSRKKPLELGSISNSETTGLLRTPHDRNGCESQPLAIVGTGGPTALVDGRDGTGEGAAQGPEQSGLVGETGLEQRVQVQFLARPSFINTYQQVRALLSNRMPHTSFAEVFEAVMNEFIDRHSPRRREERRAAREERRREKEEQASGESPAPIGQTRHIPAAVRDAVYIRDEGKCTYVGPGGIRCESTMGVQIDHIVPLAKGGGGTVSNLRLLCGKHNRLEAERVLGLDMTQFRRGE